MKNALRGGVMPGRRPFEGSPGRFPGGSGRVAGPVTTAPSMILKVLPWQGQSMGRNPVRDLTPYRAALSAGIMCPGCYGFRERWRQ
jgi:hypothetical protein